MNKEEPKEEEIKQETDKPSAQIEKVNAPNDTTGKSEGSQVSRAEFENLASGVRMLAQAIVKMNEDAAKEQAKPPEPQKPANPVDAQTAMQMLAMLNQNAPQQQSSGLDLDALIKKLTIDSMTEDLSLARAIKRKVLRGGIEQELRRVA